MKGIGCYAWDTPEIVRAKKSYELQSEVSSNFKDKVTFSKLQIQSLLCSFYNNSLCVFILCFCVCFKQIKYRAESKKEFNNYSIVTDTPIYVTAILGHTWASEVCPQSFHFTFINLKAQFWRVI